MPVQTVIKIRRDTATNWTSTNPVLGAGEWALESNTKKVKLGDGTTAWTSLAYFGNLEALDNVGDVVITSAATGQVLQYDGTNWVNSDLAISEVTGLGTGVATFLATPSSANLRAAVTDEAGTAGGLVFANSPTFTAGIIVSGNGANISIGRTDNVATTAYIDFNSGATSVDYDSRIVATGGNGSNAGGTFQIQAGSVVLPAATTIGSVSSTELGYLDGVTSAIQTQLGGKLSATITSPATGQIVQYNGTAWVNVEAPSGESFSPFLLMGA